MATTNDIKSATDSVKKQEIAFGISADDVATGNWFTKVFDRFAGKEIADELVPFVSRDIGYKMADMAAEHSGVVFDYLRDSQLPGSEQLSGISSDAAKPIIQKSFHAAVTLAGPAISLGNHVKWDRATRAELGEALEEYRDAGFKGIRPSSLFPGGSKDNAILQTLENRTQAQFNVGLWKTGAALAFAGGQHFAREQDRKAKDEGITRALAKKHPAEKGDKSTLEERVKESNKDLWAAANEEKKNYRLLTTSFMNKEGEINYGDDEELEYKIYKGPLNSLNVTMLGSAVTGGQMKSWAQETQQRYADSIIAFDLITYLNEEVKRGNIEGGNIDISRFMRENKGHDFQRLNCKDPESGNNRSDVALSEFIAEIFEQNVVDYGGEGISSRYRGEVDTIAGQLSDAITGKDKTGLLLHPLGLIKLVGEGKLVSREGYDIAPERQAEDVINNVREQMPFEMPVDPERYALDMGVSESELRYLVNEELPEEAKQAVVYLLPRDVLTEVVGMEDAEVRRNRVNHGPEALEVIKDVIRDMDAQGNDALRANFLKDGEIKKIHAAADMIEEGREDDLLQVLRDSEQGSLRFALVSNQTYWHDIAAGHHTIGSIAPPLEEVAREPKAEAKEKKGKEVAASEKQEKQTRQEGKDAMEEKAGDVAERSREEVEAKTQELTKGLEDKKQAAENALEKAFKGLGGGLQLDGLKDKATEAAKEKASEHLPDMPDTKGLSDLTDKGKLADKAKEMVAAR